MQSDQGLNYPLTESLDTTGSMNGEQRPRSYLEHAQDDLNLHILRMFLGTFFHKMWPICHSCFLSSFSVSGSTVMMSLNPRLRLVASRCQELAEKCMFFFVFFCFFFFHSLLGKM